ncbi:MAG: hypothetical protein OEY85_04000 [Rhodospirillales bacterium]|nr:hypothetical protein [Rhodospirillales bacterium]
MIKKLLPLVLILLVACETKNPVQALPDITFSQFPRLTLNVGRIDVSSSYRPPLKAPNVEHLLPVSPEKATRSWARDRLEKSSVSINHARFTIITAPVIESKLKQSSGLKGLFTKEQAERYTATVEANLEIFDDRGFRRGFASARAQRSRTIAEDASLNQREKMWFDLVEALMTDFNAEMEKNIRVHLVGWVR